MTVVIVVGVWLALIVMVVWGWARFMAPMRQIATLPDGRPLCGNPEV